MDTNSTFNSSLADTVLLCTNSQPSRFIFLALMVFYILLAPLFGFVLYIGFAKWRKQRHHSSLGNIGHSDAFMLNMAAVEAMNILSVSFMYCASFLGHVKLWVPGFTLYSIASNVQTFFHCVICVERYTAVVRPVAYLRLRNQKGVTARNLIIAVVWVFCSGVNYLCFICFSYEAEMIWGLLYNVCSLPAVSFCSVSVLCVLMRPAPGDGGGDRKQIDQSKRAAFATIMAISGVLVLRFFVAYVLYLDDLSKSKQVDTCVIKALTFWLKLPSSLVLPLLFLLREGKLRICKK